MISIHPPRGFIARARKSKVHPRATAVYSTAAKVEKDMVGYLKAALLSLRGSVSDAQLVKLMQTANPEEVFAAMKSGVEAVAVNLAHEMEDAVLAGAALASAEAVGGAVVIDAGRPAIQSWLSANAARLVKDIDDQQRKALRAVITDGVMQGRHPRQLAKDVKAVIGLNQQQAGAVNKLRATLLAKGKSPAQVDAAVSRYADRLLSQRARTIAHTESMSAVNQGRMALWEQLVADGGLATTDEHEWLTGADEMVCPWCEQLHGTVLPIGGEFSATVKGRTLKAKMPPLHPSCVPSGSAIGGPEVVAATRRQYEGDLVDIETAAGARFSVTPNHPIFTPRGLVAAEFVDVGQDVLGDGFGQRVPGSARPSVLFGVGRGGCPDRKNGPSKIEEIFDSLRFSEAMAFAKVPASKVQFHGDGSIDGQVEIVRPHSLLWDDIEPSVNEPLRDHQFFIGCMRHLALFGSCARAHRSERGAGSSEGIMSSRRKLLALVCAGLLHSEVHRLGSVPWDDSAGKEPGPDGGSGDAESSGQGLLRHAPEVETANFISGHICNGALHWDRVLSVGRRFFSGHVYNLQTGEGWYSCNGIVTGNCRCTTALVLE